MFTKKIKEMFMAKKTKSIAAKEKVPAKSVDKCCCSGDECCTGTEDSFSKLLKSGILANFVKSNKGSWDHQKWIKLCDEISEKGYSSIDFNQVGLALEQEKDNYFPKKK